MFEPHACCVCGAPAAIRIPVYRDFRTEHVALCAACACAGAGVDSFSPPVFRPNVFPANAGGEKVSGDDTETARVRDRLGHLASLLKKAVRVENYEEAARRRDEIIRLEKQLAPAADFAKKPVPF